MSHYLATVHLLMEVDHSETDIPDALNAILTEDMRKYSRADSCLIDWAFAHGGSAADAIVDVSIPADYAPDDDPFPFPGAADAVSGDNPDSGTLADPMAIAKRLAAMGHNDQIIASALALHALTILFKEIFGQELAGHFQLNTLTAIDKLLKSAGIDALAAAVSKLSEPAPLPAAAEFDGPWEESVPEDGDGDDTVLICNSDADSYEVIRINDGETEERKDIARQVAALLNRGRATLQG